MIKKAYFSRALTLPSIIGLALINYSFVDTDSAIAQSNNNQAIEQSLQKGVQLLRSGEFEASSTELETTFNQFCLNISEANTTNCINIAGNLGIIYAALGKY